MIFGKREKGAADYSRRPSVVEKQSGWYLREPARTFSETSGTDEELMALPDEAGQRYEVVDEELVEMSPAGYKHGEIRSRLLIALRNPVNPRELGEVLGFSTGFWMARDNFRAPDISDISQERLNSLGEIEGFFRICGAR
ncbi:MAG TPA: Uma2 family endonuclease [Chthoniobacterales bacterium]